MTEANWKTRVLDAVDAFNEANGLSDNSLSQRAGLSRNYVEQLRKKNPNGQIPRMAELQKLCNHIGVSLIYVLTGFEMDAEGEELIRLLANKSRAAKRHVIGLLRD